MKTENTWRFYTTAFLIAVVGIATIAQAARLQLNPENAVFESITERYRGYIDYITSPRGQIYDRDGHLLAGNQVVYEVGVSLYEIPEYAREETAEDIALLLNSALELDYDEVFSIINDPSQINSPYIVFQFDVPEEIGLKLIKAKQDRYLDIFNGKDFPSINSMILTPRLMRSYPENGLASNVLGLFNIHNLSVFGVEEYYDDHLSGIPEKVWIPIDPNYVDEMPETQSNTNLILTIDREIQSMVEDELEKAVEKYHAEAGTIIVMDPQTGEILAMASSPNYDLNDHDLIWETFTSEDPPTFNKSISYSFEPGSVFKIFTMAAALESGSVTPETEYDIEESFFYGGRTIYNWDNEAWGIQDMTGCLQHSLNVCFAWIATEMGEDVFYDFIEAFHFGRSTQIDMSGENSGIVRTPTNPPWYDIDLVTNSFGQGISVTPIQILKAASAIANNGQMVTPHIVKTIIQEDRILNSTIDIVGQPISEETAQILTDMLVDSLEEEASVALVPGYRIAGKTGTASIPLDSGVYASYITNASFLGWGPAEDPQFMIYIWLEKPIPIWGSLTAAPTFSEIATRLVVMLNLPYDPEHYAENK